MTTNQINYWKNVETERSNRRNEQIEAHKANTQRLNYLWNKEYQTHKLFLDAVNAGNNFVQASTQGYKNVASGIKDQMSGAASLSGLFS